MNIIKKAELGGEPDSAFEQSFATLARQYLKDKAPALAKHEVGFQLLDKEDDHKSVGVFGFQVGSKWFYVPVFFLSGNLKGHELLYLKHKDMFIPLKDGWINELVLKHKPNVLGKEVDRNLSQLGVVPPSLYQLSRAPNKFASAIKWSSWAQEVGPDIAHFATTNPFEDAKYDTVRSLPDIIKEAGAPLTVALVKAMADEPKLAKYIDDFYGLDFVDHAVKSAQEERISAMGILDRNNVDSKESQRPPTPSELVNPSLSKLAEKANEKLHIVEDKITKPYKGGNVILDDNDKKTLVRERVVIKDERQDVSIAYNVQTNIRLFNPDASGLYDLLVKPGDFEKCLVITGPYTNKTRKEFCTVVRVDSPKAWTNTHPYYVWGQARYEGEAWTGWVDGLKPVSELSKGGPYVIIGPKGEGTVPFDIEREVSNEEGIKTFDIYCHCYSEKGRPGFLPVLERDHFTDRDLTHDYGYHASQLTLTNREGAHLVARGGTLYVPKGYKFLKVKDDDHDGNSIDCCCSFGSRPAAIHLGNAVDAEIMLFGKLAEMEIRNNGTVVSINNRDFEPMDALIHLVAQHGLREKQARIMLAESEAEKRSSYFIKYAAPYDLLNQGPSAPPFPEPNYGYDPLTDRGVTTMYNSEALMPVPDLQANATDRDAYKVLGNDPTYGVGGPDQESMSVAMQAAETGQKEVFDTAMLGSLLKATRDDNLVDRYIGDLLKGMDRLGRILFQFYWHQDQFEDRYGKGDMTELEDGLRNAFEAVGDIILFLNQRKISSGPDDMYNQIHLDAVASM